MARNLETVKRHALKGILSLIFIFCLSAYAQDQPFTYSKVRITIQSDRTFQRLAQNGLIFDHVSVEKQRDGSRLLTAVINERELKALQNSGLSYQVLVPDVVKAYQKRATLSSVQRAKITASQDVPEGFELGSMGGYYTFDEVKAELDSMHLMYPDLTTAKQSIGQSHENRHLWMVKISDNPESDESEPELFYNGLHHAREPQSMMTVVYFMYYLLENYGVDPEVTYLVDNREFYFVPVLNPDGYVYNEQTNPDGGGQWRKNRRINEGDWYGVDLNRNYGYKWGYDDEGSSPYPWSDTYRGPDPFSEPETQAVRDFSKDRHFVLSLSYHSYSNLLIHPWGYEESLLTKDSLTFFDYASEMTRHNQYTYGTGDETVGYITNGDSDDWFYGEESQKNKILAMTPEVGSDEDGFWPEENRIIPLAKENIHPNMRLAWYGGGFARYRNYDLSETAGDQDGYIGPGEQASITFNIGNMGQDVARQVSLSLSTDDPYITLDKDNSNQTVDILSQTQVRFDSLLFTVADETPAGHRPKFTLTINQEGVERRDTIQTVILGKPTVAFSDDAESGSAQWDTGNSWAVDDAKSYEGDHAFTDSPDRNYAADSHNILTLAQAMELENAEKTYLEFFSRWQIERDYDFARVQVSTDGNSWQTVSGLRSVSGSGKGEQSTSESGYDDMQLYWVKEVIDISAFAPAASFYVRFRMDADGGVERNGWFIDQIRILSYKETVSPITDASPAPASFRLLGNYPNPFNAGTRIAFVLPDKGKVRLDIYDIQGNLVQTLLDGRLNAGKHEHYWNGLIEEKLPAASGIYYYRLKYGQRIKTGKMLHVK